MRKCLARALYMQRKCRVKCVKDVQFKASLEQIYIFNYTAEGQDDRLLKLGLGRAEFVLLKKIFRNSESLAVNKQRLLFLRQCSRLNVFQRPSQTSNYHMIKGLYPLLRNLN